jgi:hypothetical protein
LHDCDGRRIAAKQQPTGLPAQPVTLVHSSTERRQPQQTGAQVELGVDEMS